MESVQGWASVGMMAVLLLYQFGLQWLQTLRHQSNTNELDGIRAELTECKARSIRIEQEQARTVSAIRLLTLRLPPSEEESRAT